MTFELKKHIVLAFIMLVTVVAYAQVKVEARLDTTNILVGGQTNLCISVTAKSGTRIGFPAFKPTQNMSPGIEVVETTCDTLDVGNDVQVFSKNYMLTSWDEGKYEVPAQDVKVDGKNYKTRSITLTVMTVEVDTTNTSVIKPAKDVQDNPFSWADWSPLFWLSILAVLLCLLVYYLRIRLAENKPVISRIRFIRKLLPHQKALKAIEQIKAEQLTHSEDQKVYYTKLTDALRCYLAERFGINAMEMTSGDILERLKAEEDRSKIDELRDVFETADLVKFAKYSAQANMNDMYLANVVKFIDDTKQENMPVMEKVEDPLAVKEKRNARERKVMKVVIAVAAIAAVAILVYVGWQIYGLLG